MTDRDKLFCIEYTIDFNAKHAAIRAGFSPSTARNAADWINPDKPQKPAVRTEIDRLLAVQSRRLGVSADRIVSELAKIAFANADDIIDANTAELKADANRDDIAAVASVKVKCGDDFTEREIKLCDKTRALELLGKRFGLFADTVQVQGAVPVIIDDTPEATPEDKKIQGFQNGE